MSTIRKKPYIETVISNLNETELTTLINVLNSQSTTQVDFSTVQAGIYGVNFRLSNTETKTGILIANDDVECLVCYHRFQDLLIYDLDLTNKTYTKVNEYCDINELRRIVTIAALEVGVIEITPEMLAEVIEGSESVTIDTNEAGTKLQAKIDEDVLDFILPKEVNPTAITHDPGDTNTIITVDPGVFDTDNAYHIYLEIEGSGLHYGADFTVFAYNQATCLSVFSLIVNGDTKECFASFGDDGTLNIDLPIVMAPESQDTIIHYKRVI